MNWVDKIKEHYGTETFTSHEVSDITGLTPRSIAGRLRTNKNFVKVGYRVVFLNPFNPKEKVNLWQFRPLE